MPIAMVDLTADAAAEAGRVAFARSLLRDGDEHALTQLEASAAWIVSARRRRTRRALGASAVLLWRVAYEDGSGRMLESRLVPVVVQMTARRGAGSRRSARALAARLEAAIRGDVEAACVEWQRAAAAAVRRVASMEASRAHGITASTGRLVANRYQPGLFDRRAEQQRTGQIAFTTEAGHAAADRLAAAGRLSGAQPRPPRLLLVLAP
jgi:hypothetical protein